MHNVKFNNCSSAL